MLRYRRSGRNRCACGDVFRGVVALHARGHHLNVIEVTRLEEVEHGVILDELTSRTLWKSLHPKLALLRLR